MIRRRERIAGRYIEIGWDSVRLRLLAHLLIIVGQGVTAVVSRCRHGRRPAGGGRRDGVLPQEGGVVAARVRPAERFRKTRAVG